MNAQQMLAAITRIEVNPQFAPDFRRILRDHARYPLTEAIKSGRGDEIKEAMSEAVRIAGNWGVTLQQNPGPL